MIPPSRGDTPKQLPERLLGQLSSLPETTAFWVGFSGGADSTALLEALLKIQPELSAEIRAIHFNHGLQQAAGEWQLHCQTFCQAREVPLLVQNLELDFKEGISAETQARQARYGSLEKLLGANEIYLTAHHADDQAETLLLHLLRGSGLDGLAGIPTLRKLGRGWVARPLLDFRRQDLEDFLRHQNTPWITDPSNLEVIADRNFLRNDIFPRLESRWPGTIQRLNQSARHAAAAAAVLSELIAGKFGQLLSDPYTLPLEHFLGLDPEIQALVLRQWVKLRNVSTPPRPRLAEFLAQLSTSTSVSSQAEIKWSGWMIKRYDSSLWLHETSFPRECPATTWRSDQKLRLDADFGNLQVFGDVFELPPGWEIGPRKKRAAMQVRKNGSRKKVKELLRACGIPTWLRPSVPMLYRDGQLQAIGDWLLCPELRDWLTENQLSYLWHPVHPLLCKLQSVSVQCLAASEFKND